MKRLILIFLLIVVCGIVFWKYFFSQSCLPPSKPKGLPVNTVWKGDCDGGHWLEFVSSSEDKIRFKVYRDWNGKLILDANFKYEDCGTLKLSKSNWKKHVAYFDETLELYQKSTEGNNCRLKPVFPAYKSENLE